MSQSRSRARLSRSATPSQPPLTDAGSIILPEAPVTDQAAELIHEFVHPHHHEAEETLIEEVEADADSVDIEYETRHTLPWWGRPSPVWILVFIPFTSIAMSATIAPKVEIYTQLACSIHKPDIFDQNLLTFSLSNSSASMLDIGGTVEGPKQSNPCAADPVVQAAVAKLSAVLLACMGILSCLTSAWWGAFSDRHGRTRVMSLSVLGLLATDANFILVYHLYDRIPGGYWFLILGPIIEGCLGGMTTAIAAIHAYVADTTTSETRSRVFSLNLGLLFTGMAIGPTLGGILIRVTQNTMSVFYVAACVHLLYAFFVWTVLPESLTQKQMGTASANYDKDLAQSTSVRQSNRAIGMLVRLKRLFTFLSPLTVFLPEEVQKGSNPLKMRKRDWNLTILAIAYGCTISIMGSYTYKFQYAAATFGWTSETIGYWLSLVGAARAVYLTIILPIIIKLLKPKQPSVAESEPLLNSRSSRPSNFSFELGLARASLIIEMFSYTLMGVSTLPLAFTVSAMMGSMGTGFSPALQSVAVELYSRRGSTESGRLFGALSVVQALCGQILGPSLYGFVYMRTVATAPRAIFFVSVASLVISILLMAFLRVPKNVPAIVVISEDIEEQETTSESSNHPREATLVSLDDDEVPGTGTDRGRSSKVSPLVSVQ